MYEYFPKQVMGALLSRFGLWTVAGLMHVPKYGSLNERFPEIKTITVSEVIGAWKGK